MLDARVFCITYLLGIITSYLACDFYQLLATDWCPDNFLKIFGISQHLRASPTVHFLKGERKDSMAPPTATTIFLGTIICTDAPA